MKLSGLILFAALLTACGGSGGRAQKQPESTPERANSATNSTPPSTASEGNAHAPPEPSAEAKAACLAVDTGDNVVLKAQTFPIDFAPFEDSCFVTSHNPEFDDPPMESNIAIYRSGKKVFDFPSQFNGATFGCWVDAVAFQDLNTDGRTDIIVVGKCNAKSQAYNENMVYVNTGKAFTTDADANLKISEMAKVKDIADFVRKNQNIFFK
jgi:hypothetical protein